MKVVVVGSSGTMGSLVCNQLGERGAQVVEAHRGNGVDAQTGAGLAAAVADADVVVDCLNNITQSARKAKAFFGTAARNIAEAASAAGARVVQPAVEVEVGDLILDLAASPEVTLFEGQSVSGAKPLDDLADHGLRFIWNGKVFSTQNISPDLQATWDAYVGNQQLHRTLLLRRA